MLRKGGDDKQMEGGQHRSRKCAETYITLGGSVVCGGNENRAIMRRVTLALLELACRLKLSIVNTDSTVGTHRETVH